MPHRHLVGETNINPNRLTAQEIEDGCVATHYACKSWVDERGVEHNKYKSSIFVMFKTQKGKKLYRNSGAFTPATESLEQAVAAGKRLAEQYKIPYRDEIGSLHNKPVPVKAASLPPSTVRSFQLRPSCLGGDM